MASADEGGDGDGAATEIGWDGCAPSSTGIGSERCAATSTSMAPDDRRGTVAGVAEPWAPPRSLTIANSCCGRTSSVCPVMTGSGGSRGTLLSAVVEPDRPDTPATGGAGLRTDDGGGPGLFGTATCGLASPLRPLNFVVRRSAIGTCPDCPGPTRGRTIPVKPPHSFVSSPRASP